MERRTLLEIVNDVMYSMDYDPVNDISETPESEQVANMVRGEYFKLAAELDLDTIRMVDQLTGLGDTNYPTTMKIPASVAQVTNIRYDNTETGDSNQTIDDITYYEDPNDFLDLVYSRNTGDSEIDVVNDNVEGVPLFIRNDQGPTYCTSFDGEYIVFDAYNSAEESTLQQSNSIVVGVAADAWSHTNAAYPVLPVRHFSLFISQCKIVCNEQMRQVTLRSEREDRRYLRNKAKREKRLKNSHTKPNFGRHRQ